MIRPRDFINVLEKDDAEPITIDDTGGALLLHLLVHMFFADEELHDQELGVLRRLVGGDENDELREQVTQLNKLPMNFAKLAEVYPERQDRLDVITLAEHGFWADNQMKFSEMDVLDRLAEAFEIEER
jgi:uncharacterized tellurite resistance protein B-like protein